MIIMIMMMTPTMMVIKMTTAMTTAKTAATSIMIMMVIMMMIMIRSRRDYEDDGTQISQRSNDLPSLTKCVFTKA